MDNQQRGHMQAHFVTFYSPGTFVAEQSTEPIESWNIDKAKAMAGGVTERYGAKPYGFQLTTRTRTDEELDSKVTATSPMYFINCKVRTLEEVEADNDPKEKIMLSNMRGN